MRVTKEGIPMPLRFESAEQALLSPLHQATTKEELVKSAARRTKTVEDMRTYWGRIRKEKPLSQRIIHITGTKGKGSTACMCEAIMRKHGYSTGLFTSPHLMDIRERIRWNGKPIASKSFGQIYWKVRQDLEAADIDIDIDIDIDNSDDDQPPKLPGYFRMLTLMAFYAFGQLQVDVLILEVGMGGRYDATNFLDGERVCGVTLLDLDHTRILGNTLEQIAWEKGGIFATDKVSTNISPKPTDDEEPIDDTTNEEKSKSKSKTDEARRLYVLDSNTTGVLRVFRQCAQIEGRGGDLTLVDANGSALRSTLQRKSLGLAGQHQYGNATLAVHLCQAVVEGTGTTDIQFHSQKTTDALVGARWPARCQTVEQYPFTFRLDGAHTPQSLGATMEWFTHKTAVHPRRILVFNTSHERNPVELLQLLSPTTFTEVYFAKSDSSRPSPVSVPSATELLQAQNIPVQPELLMYSSKHTSTWQETLGSVWNHLTAERKHATVKCNLTATEVLADLSSRMIQPTEVLVTGSLYLVGSFLIAIKWSEESSLDSPDL
jgi:folylpolyglutamate synthase